jgi:hypothetical protein
LVNIGTRDFIDAMTDAKLLFGYNNKRFNEPKEILYKSKKLVPFNHCKQDKMMLLLLVVLIYRT